MELDFFEMEAHAKKLMDYCKKHMNSILKDYRGSELNIETEFSLNTTINAKSVLKDGQYKAILNNGAYVAVFRFYETKFLEGDDKTFYYKLTKNKEYNKITAKYYFDLMLDITLLAFIFHEYGHIYNGHLDYLTFEGYSRNNGNSSVSLNADGEHPSVLFPIRHQALEWNADDFSATRVIESMFGYHYWKWFERENELSFLQLFWVVVNAMTVSFCLMGSKKETASLQNSLHLPPRFRALSFINTAEKKLKKWTGAYDISPSMINDAIDLAKREIEIYDINFSSNVSKDEKLHYVATEYDLLVKLPVILIKYQHLQSINPETALQTMLKLYDLMTQEEREKFENMLSANGKNF